MKIWHEPFDSSFINPALWIFWKLKSFCVNVFLWIGFCLYGKGVPWSKNGYLEYRLHALDFRMKNQWKEQKGCCGRSFPVPAIAASWVETCKGHLAQELWMLLLLMMVMTMMMIRMETEIASSLWHFLLEIIIL